MLYNKGKKEYKVALTHNMMYLITDTKIQRARKEQKKKKNMKKMLVVLIWLH